MIVHAQVSVGGRLYEINARGESLPKRHTRGLWVNKTSNNVALAHSQ